MRVVAAGGIDNEFKLDDIRNLERLKEKGVEIELVYYTYKVPPQYAMIPTVNESLRAWRQHGQKMLRAVGDQVGIPEERRLYVNEILGADEVFNKAREFNANSIVTPNPAKLHQSFLSAFYDKVHALFANKATMAVPVEEVGEFVNDIESQEVAAKGETQRTIEPSYEKQPTHGSIFTSQRDLKKAHSTRKDQGDDKEVEIKRYKK